MKKDTNIIVRINSDLKKNVTDLATREGVTLSQLITASLVSICHDNRIPYSMLKYLPLKYGEEKVCSISQIKKITLKLLEENHVDDVSKVYLFGSYARGDATPRSNINMRVPSHDWNGVLDAMYAYMAKVQAGGTGVFPDWSNAAGVAADAPNGSAKNTYYQFNKESVRIPWRIAWDYYWFQEPRAATVLNGLYGFISPKSGNDPTSLALGTSYSWNLSLGADKTSNVVGAYWLGAWCSTGISGNADWLNLCTAELNKKMPSNTTTSYFADILLVMYSQLLNGAFVKSF